jgi:multidrug efflux pump subunit AcrA (membrane-fusion protein)
LTLQKREADVHPARVGLARQECDEAERELARAETLKREAREQLQVAAAEKNYAKRAREAAKRQVEISEAELASAQRLRAHALAELQKASSPSSFCHSCKSALELTTTSPPSRRSTSTSPTSWSMMAPYSPSTQHQTSKAHHMLTNPGINRMSWSAFQQPDRKFDQIAPQDLDLNKIS